MSAAEFATVILMLCGKGTSEAHTDCHLYYVNCVINKSTDIKMESIDACKRDSEKGIEKMKALREGK